MAWYGVEMGRPLAVAVLWLYALFTGGSGKKNLQLLQRNYWVEI